MSEVSMAVFEVFAVSNFVLLEFLGSMISLVKVGADGVRF